MYYDHPTNGKRMWRCAYCKNEYDCADRIDHNAIRIGNRIIGLTCLGKCTEIIEQKIKQFFDSKL